MKKNQYFLNTVLAIVVFVACAVALLVRVWFPAAVIPALNIPNMVLLSLIALLLERLIAKDNPRCYVCVILFGAAAFGLLPLMAGFTCVHEFWKLSLVGGITFAVTTYLFSSATQRLRSGPKAPLALLITCLGIYLAAQSLTGILL